MDPQSLTNYLQDIERITCKLEEIAEAPKELFDTIESYKSKNIQSADYFEEFFKGEEAFYHGQYEIALHHYLQARKIEHFEFFCYRTSAGIFKRKGEIDKALKFIKKALEIYPDDPVSQLMLHFLSSKFSENLDYPESILFNKPLMKEPHKILLESPSRLTVSEKEIEELAGIFETRLPEEELFGSSDLSSIFKQTTNPSTLSNLPSQSASISKEPNTYRYPNFSDPQTATMLAEDLHAYKDVPNPTLMNFFSHSSKTALNFNSSLQPLDAPVPPSGLTQELDLSIHAFKTLSLDMLKGYAEQWIDRDDLNNCFLMSFHGWGEKAPLSSSRILARNSESWRFFIEETFKQTGGFYLRWNRKGIVLNPGKHFLANFHQSGFHIRDIDYVIATHSEPDIDAEMQSIYNLNNQLNQVLPQPQIIHYYVNQTDFFPQSNSLKLRSKQDKETIHSLELYADSPHAEKYELGPGIVLNYFSIYPLRISSLGEHHKNRLDPIGLKLELNPLTSQLQQGFNLGYISGASWSPHIAPHLMECSVILAGFGHTNNHHYQGISSPIECLGYSGIFSLLQEVNPKILLFCEFSGKEGDIRLEVVRKMRHEYGVAHSQNSSAIILPGDLGLFLDLKSFRIRCSLTQQLINPADIRIFRSSGFFSRLHYVSSSCCL